MCILIPVRNHLLLSMPSRLALYPSLSYTLISSIARQRRIIVPSLPDIEEVKIIRERLGMTQRKLARACDISQSFINKIERNEANPGYKTVKIIFEALNEGANRNYNQSKDSSKAAKDVMVNSVENVSTKDSVEDARKKMLKYGYSQLAVIDSEIVKGSITDRLIISLKKEKEEGAKVGQVMGKKFPIVSPETKLETISHILGEHPAVLVDRGEKQYSIVTKHDLLKAHRHQ
jgi:predicted transcriptional regulator